MNSKNDVIVYLYELKAVDDYINKYVYAIYKKDFKDFIISEFMEMDEVFLVNLYNKSPTRVDLLKYCYRVMNNQWKSKTSKFYKLYKNSGKVIEITNDEHYQFIFNDYYPDDCENETNNTIYSREMKKTLLNILRRRIMEANVIKEIDEEKEIKKVKAILNSIDPINAYCFEQYYFQKKTYKEIEAETDVNYQTIRKIVLKTLAFVKAELKK